jgi:competence protein ComEA
VHQLVHVLIAACLALLSASIFAATEANLATEAELDNVKGLGPSSTARIMKERAQAPFTDWPDFLKRVKGFKPTKAQALSNAGLTVNGTPYAAPKP